MSRGDRSRAGLLLGAASLALVVGCGHGVTTYTPQLRAEGELTLHYDDGLSMTAEGREIASGVGWGGLTEYVACVPKAKDHAESAETIGGAAKALSWTGAGIGLASLGSLSGAVIYEKNQDLGLAILGIGVSAAITGVVLAAVGRNMKNSANGHAVDAMNYYNDAVGSRGGTCRKQPPKLPEVTPQAPPSKGDMPTLEEIQGGSHQKPADAKPSDPKPADTKPANPKPPANPDEI